MVLDGPNDRPCLYRRPMALFPHTTSDGVDRRSLSAYLLETKGNGESRPVDDSRSHHSSGRRIWRYEGRWRFYIPLDFALELDAKFIPHKHTSPHLIPPPQPTSPGLRAVQHPFSEKPSSRPQVTGSVPEPSWIVVSAGCVDHASTVSSSSS